MFVWIKNRIGATEKSALINMALKPVSAILSLVYTPILLEYLGDEKYGLWATILSVITWISFFDVGIGNGLRNLLSRLVSEKKEIEAKKAVSTAYIVLSTIATILFAFLAFMSFSADWYYIFSTSIPLKLVLLITFLFICVNFVLALSNTILYALHKAEFVSVRSCLVQAANIICLLVVRKFSKENLTVIAILFGSTSAFFYIEASASIFKKHLYLRPSTHYFDKKMIKEISGVGIKFFIIQVMGLLLFTVDNMLITHFFGSTKATPFSITNKVFNTIYSAFMAFAVPYWSRTTVAYNQGDLRWIKKSIKKVLAVGMGFIACYFIMAVLFEPVINIWLKRNLDNQSGLVFLMAFFYSIYTLMGVECQFINGTGLITTQLIIYIIIGILNIPLSIIMGVYLGMGCFGIRLATTVLVVIAVIVLGIDLRNTIRNAEETAVNNVE